MARQREREEGGGNEMDTIKEVEEKCIKDHLTSMNI